MDWEDEMWTGDLTKREGRWESCRTEAEPNHEIVKGIYLKYRENGVMVIYKTYVCPFQGKR